MADFTHMAARLAFSKGIDIMLRKMQKDRVRGMLDLVDIVEKYVGDMFTKEKYDNIRGMIRDPNEKWNIYVNRLLDELDPNVLKMTLLNLGFEAMFHGTKTIRANREKYDCNIPWLILMDPTSACNLHCVGCWAAEYGNRLNLSYEDLDRVVTQGKELGIYFYMFTGGEPLVRKCFSCLYQRHPDRRCVCGGGPEGRQPQFLHFSGGIFRGQRHAPRRGRIRQSHACHGRSEEAWLPVRNLDRLHKE